MDAVTFQSEVLKIERLLYHVAYTALGNRQECADAVKEALLRAWKKRGSLRSQDHFKAWMVRILLNTIADGKRRGKLPTTELSDTLPAEERPDNLPLYEALRALPEGMRYAVVLVYLDGLHHARVRKDAARARGHRQKPFKPRQSIAARLPVGGGLSHAT